MKITNIQKYMKILQLHKMNAYKMIELNID